MKPMAVENVTTSYGSRMAMDDTMASAYSKWWQRMRWRSSMMQQRSTIDVLAIDYDDVDVMVVDDDDDRAIAVKDMAVAANKAS
jgi:hypothetical protein